MVPNKSLIIQKIFILNNLLAIMQYKDGLVVQTCLAPREEWALHMNTLSEGITERSESGCGTNMAFLSKGKRK